MIESSSVGNTRTVARRTWASADCARSSRLYFGGCLMTDFAQDLVPAAQMSRRRLFQGLLAIGIGVEVLTLLPARGIAAPDPQTVVNYVATQGMATVASNASPAQRNASMHQLFDQYFDVGHIAPFALGRYR